MKKEVYFLIFFSLLGYSTLAQQLSTIDSTKYRINLPDYWRAGNKVWRILTDKLPEISEELKDKEICGDDCNPWLRVEFEMSEPVIFQHFPNHILASYTTNTRSTPYDIWDIQTSYGFECSLLLMDNHDKILTRFILVDTNETWKISNRVRLTSYAPSPLPVSYVRRTRFGVIYDPSIITNAQQYMPTAPEGETPFAYINRNWEKLIPSRRDMLAVIDAKINSW